MRNLVALLAVGCALLAGPTKAGVIIQPGSTVYLNFNLTSATPPPLYLVMLVQGDFTYAGTPFPTGMSAALFGGLDGTAGLIAPMEIVSPTGCSLGQSCFMPTNASIDARALDGIFSVGLFAASGSGTWNLFAIGCALVNPSDSMCTDTSHINGVASTVVTVGNATVTVPEPATLALLSLGLSSLALTRRRKSN